MQTSKETNRIEIPVGIEAFIKCNPYPTMEEMETIQSFRIDLDSEYGLLNHKLCKEVYENMYKKNSIDYVNAFIEGVKSTGGSQALKCNLETLKNYSPISKITDLELYIMFIDIYNYVVSKL
jgi:hypothetical protein